MVWEPGDDGLWFGALELDGGLGFGVKVTLHEVMASRSSLQLFSVLATLNDKKKLRTNNLRGLQGSTGKGACSWPIPAAHPNSNHDHTGGCLAKTQTMALLIV